MRYTRTAITQLTKMYRSVLKKCAFFNALILTGVITASPSWADITTRMEIDSADTANITENVSVNSGDVDGGAFYNAGTLNITGSTVTNNHTNQKGGAIYNTGTLTIVDTNFNSNTATGNGGAIYSTTGFSVDAGSADVVFSDNTAGDTGNDIYMQGTSGSDITLTLNAAAGQSITLGSGVAGEYYDMSINATSTSTGTVSLGAVAGVDNINVDYGTASATTVDANSLTLNGNSAFTITGDSAIDTLTTGASTTLTIGDALADDLIVQSASNAATIDGPGMLVIGDGTSTGTFTNENMGLITTGIFVNSGSTLTTAGVDDTTTPTKGVTGSIVNAGDLTVQGGTIVGAVSGDGKTTISGNVTNGATITGNDIVVAAGSTLTTAADTITDKNGVIANAATGTVDLTGGTLSQTIDGGKIEISGDVTLGGTPAPTNYFTNNVSTTIDDGATLDINTKTADLGNTKLGDSDPTTGAGNATVSVEITDLTNGSSTYEGGQLNVGGNLTTDSDSKLKLDIADGLLEEQHSQSGSLNVVNVTGTGGFTGDQIEVSSDYEVTVNPDGSIVIVNKNSYADVSSAAIGSANNVSAAIGWDWATNLPDGSVAREIQKTLNKVSKNNPAAYVNALTNIAPTDTAMYQGIALQVDNLIGEQVASRLSNQGMNSGDVFERQGVWVKALYNHAEQDSDRSNPGFTGRTKGIAFGIDGQVDENTTFGFGYSYSQTDADSLNREIDITGHNIFAYGKYQPSAWFIRGMVNYGISDYEEKSHILGFVKTADYDVKNYGLRTYVGYDLPNGFTPEAGLRYTHLTVEKYKDSLGQVVRTNDISVLTATLGVNFSKEVETYNYKWTPKAHLGLTYDLSRDGANATVALGNSGYSIQGEALDRFGIEAGIGAEINMGDWSLSAEYDYGYRDNFTNHTGMLQLKYNF